MDHELENFKDSIVMMRNVPAVLSLDIAVFVSSILVNILGESARSVTAYPASTANPSLCRTHHQGTLCDRKVNVVARCPHPAYHSLHPLLDSCT